MNFEWIAISLSDVTSIGLAFALGLLSRSVGLPPMVGFLAAGFFLNVLGIADHQLVQKLADLGITLLLFTVGLKINLKTLARPQVWAVTVIHTSIVTLLFGVMIYALVSAGVSVFANLDFRSSLLIAFALSFSSTVYVVKALEEKGEMKSLHGQIAIGILIVQDIAAVVFLAFSADKLPSILAFSLLLLIPMRHLLHRVLGVIGHGELLILYGFLLAMGGAEIFELLGMKGDLGALFLGILIAPHFKAEEMAKTMLGFKDLFLLGFFLSIGLSGQLTIETILLGAIITPLVMLKSATFFALLSAFKLRARTSLLATINLTNFSEFGLIVMAVGAGNGWIEHQWLIVVAIAMSLSFVISALFNANSNYLYTRYRASWERLQRNERLSDDSLIDICDATIAVVGMGGIGSSAYDEMRRLHGETVIGVDIDPATVKNHIAASRNVLHGDPSDADFWGRIQSRHKLKLVMLALPKLSTTLAVAQQLSTVAFDGQMAATSKFQDEVEKLQQAGVTVVFNIYTEAGSGFAAHVSANLSKTS